jgi:indolepyruvate decarboxylase
MGREEVREYVESSDCVLLLGAFMTDINLGIYTAQLDTSRCINASSEKLSIGYHSFEGVRFKDFFRGLLAANFKARRFPAHARACHRKAPPRPPEARAGQPITVKYLFERLNFCLTDETIVIADVGDALFGAADLFIHDRTEFLSPAYYTSMGFSVPAAIGAEIGDRRLRPLVLVGDGAFQMTGMELSTAVRYNLRPVIVVLNNSGYGTERHIQDGPYNDLLRWNYHRLPEVLGAGRGWLVETEEQFDTALREAAEHTRSFSLIDVRLAPLDRSPALDRLAARLAKRV